MNDVRDRLIFWYKNNKRDLPWRQTRDPYFIWISEIIFQQTRIDQGMEYYLSFIEKFPNINALASANEEEVLKSWQGLGYYSRARNMHFSAKYIVNELNGSFPETFEEIQKLKGVGPYTAAAIASISFNLPYPVIDGNVQRLISRLFSIENAVNTSLGNRIIAKCINKIFNPENPGDFNQAMMEFGSVICKPQNPGCLDCTLNVNCSAYKSGIVDRLPLKIKNKKPKDLYLYYYVMRFSKGSTQYYYLNKRGNAGIWKGLYDFPSLESECELTKEEVLSHSNLLSLVGNLKFKVEDISAYYKHQLSHKNIKACFILCNLNNELEDSISEKLSLTNALDMDKYPVSKLISNYLEALNLY